MYNGIGLTTPRGSGTSGYVVRNLSTLRSYQHSNQQDNAWDAAPPKHREPDEGILEHERKRAVEVKCLELQLKLEDDEVDEAEIEKQVSALREKLLANMKSATTNPRSLKPSDTHAIAAAKKTELERMARALGTRQDYKEGDSFDREKQEELRLKRISEREERDRRKQEDRKKMEEQKKKWEEERRKREEERRRDAEKARESGSKGMPPPSIPTGPRRGDARSNMGPPPPRERDFDAPRRKERSPPPPPRARDVDMRDRSPPPRARKRSPSRSPSRSRSRSPSRYKRRAPERSASPRRSRSPVRRRRDSLSRSRSPRSRSRSSSRSLSASRSPSRSPRRRRRSMSGSRSRSPIEHKRRRSATPPPSSARKMRSALPTPGYTLAPERDGKARELPPHMRRGSPPPRGGPAAHLPLTAGGRDRERERERSPPPPRRGASPTSRGRTPEKRAGGGGRGRSASTGSSMSVSSRSRSGSRD